MVGRIVGPVFCLMCAVPFLIISVTKKDSKEPITFWSGDTTLKSKVKNVAEYNKMAALYKRCAIAFLISGIGFLISLFLGVIMISSEIMKVPQEFFVTTIKEVPDKNFGIVGKTIDIVKAEYMRTHK